MVCYKYTSRLKASGREETSIPWLLNQVAEDLTVGMRDALCLCRLRLRENYIVVAGEN
jgi:hypothetical protein